jgi:hypothetical protein
MAKTARWQDSFAEAAGLAARGFDASAKTPVRAELAYREANAIALFGDTPRARDALAKAKRVSEGLDDDGTSAWSFSRGRQAIFTLNVCVHTGDPDGGAERSSGSRRLLGRGRRESHGDVGSGTGGGGHGAPRSRETGKQRKNAVPLGRIITSN